MFKKLLVANRGEIACRILKTAKKMGIISVAVYSTVDRDSLHVLEADEAYLIGDAPSSSSYLNIDAIIHAAKRAGAQAIHPGYGFLSENADFVQACELNNLIFIGPSLYAMEVMGSKQKAKQLLENTSVPLTPGYHGKNQAEEYLLQEAKKIGYPILLKAAAGGGGKGMREVHVEADFYPSLAGAKREAISSFADDTMLIEKLINHPRHVEIQIMADNFGNTVHLFSRDCSIQRRHQKIIEEAPAPFLSPSLQTKLASAAVEVAKAIQYRGAGTIEFLVAGEDFYFMEMNTRLQVEHPVTEMITGLDLVEWQIRIANNELLPLDQEAISQKGHALECRIYAEDPQNHFLPSIGRITYLNAPKDNEIRIDTGIQEGTEVSQFYDPMLAKLIVHGATREEAVLKMQYALSHYAIGGIKTNIVFLKAILTQKKFVQGKIATDFLMHETLEIEALSPHEAALMAACYDYYQLKNSTHDPLGTATFAWQMINPSHWTYTYQYEGDLLPVKVFPLSTNEIAVDDGKAVERFSIQQFNHRFQFISSEKKYTLFVEDLGSTLTLYTTQSQLTLKRFSWESINDDKGASPQLIAPMPSTIVAILKNKGDKIKAGEQLMVLEAMKMEHTIHAPQDGLLTNIFYEVGAQVSEGAELATIDIVK
jgi:3-methylcrotonyl-CoA carboxylase alpha subunit